MTVFGIELNWIAAAAAALGLLFWDLRWAFCMAPGKGTLEWIARTDPPPMTYPGVSRIRGTQWAALPAAALLGAAAAICLKGIPAALTGTALFPIGISAASALCFCAMLLHSGADTPSALLASLLLSACGAPTLSEFALLLLLWMAVLACMTRSRLCFWLSLTAVIGLALLSRTAWTDAGLRLVSVSFSVPKSFPLCAALSVLTAVPLLIAAVRLHDSRKLILGLLAPVTLAAALFEMVLPAYAGALAALACMMTAARERRARFSPVLLFCLLFACIFVTTRGI